MAARRNVLLVVTLKPLCITIRISCVFALLGMLEMSFTLLQGINNKDFDIIGA